MPRRQVGRVGLMGGTFDPIHHAHLFAAEAVRDTLNLTEVIWIPAGQSPLKRRAPQASGPHRLAMVQAAIADNSRFTWSDYEIHRPGPSYTWDTVSHFRKILGDVALYFIIGADSALDLTTWHRYDELLELCRFAVVSRPGFRLEELDGRLPPHHLDRLDLVPTPGLEIGATELRLRLERGQTVRYLVPEPVRAYIEHHSLYRAEPDRLPNPGDTPRPEKAEEIAWKAKQSVN